MENWEESQDDRLERICASYADPSDRIIELEKQGYVKKGPEADPEEPRSPCPAFVSLQRGDGRT